MGKILSIILRIPLWILILASCGASFYAAYNKESSWIVPGIYAVTLILYVIGMMLKDKATDEENSKVNVNELANELAVDSASIKPATPEEPEINPADDEEDYKRLISKIEQNEVDNEGDNNQNKVRR